MATNPEIKGESLAGIELFANVGLAARQIIAEACTGHDYDPGDTVLSYKDTSRQVFMVLSGTVDVTLYSVNGRRITFNEKSAGELVGELAAIDGRPRCADVTAKTACRMASIPPEDFLQSIASHPGAALKLMQRLTVQVRELSERVFEFNALCVNNRIHVELLRSAKAGAEEGPQRIIDPAPTHADIASRVSTHREAVTRELSRLTKEGLLDKQNNALIISDIRALERLVEDSLGEIPLVC